MRPVMAVLALMIVAGFEPALALDPPDLLNYQGVLRDSSGVPLNGSFDMVFRFFEVPAGGTEVLVDEHLSAGTGSVVVSDGLFSVALGSGNVLDGPGSGTYTSLGEVFRRLKDVYLEVRVGVETLIPRTRVVSAAYALDDAPVAPPCFDSANRFVDCANGTVTDTVTGLVWLKNANCTAVFGSSKPYAAANAAAAALADGQCGLTDNSVAGDWRLPTKAEWDVIFAQAMSNGCGSPRIPDRTGLGCCGTGVCAFTGIATDFGYWSATTVTTSPTFGYLADHFAGTTSSLFKAVGEHVWPVRDPKK